MAAIRIGLVSLLCSKVRSISPRQGSSLCALLSNRSPPLLSSLSAAGRMRLGIAGLEWIWLGGWMAAGWLRARLLRPEATPSTCYALCGGSALW